MQLATTLDYLQKQLSLQDEADVELPSNNGVFEGVDVSALSYQERVPDTPFIATRAGLYVYTNGMVRMRNGNLATTMNNIFSLRDGRSPTTLLHSIF